MNPPAFCTTAPIPPTMAAINLSWDGVLAFARDSIDLLQSTGTTFLHLLETGYKGLIAATGRDYLGVFLAIQEAAGDVKVIIEAIKKEFNL